jgi:hypothetical protein
VPFISAIAPTGVAVAGFLLFLTEKIGFNRENFDKRITVETYYVLLLRRGNPVVVVSDREVSY